MRKKLSILGLFIMILYLNKVMDTAMDTVMDTVMAMDTAMDISMKTKIMKSLLLSKSEIKSEVFLEEINKQKKSNEKLLFFIFQYQLHSPRGFLC